MKTIYDTIKEIFPEEVKHKEIIDIIKQFDHELFLEISEYILKSVEKDLKVDSKNLFSYFQIKFINEAELNFELIANFIKAYNNSEKLKFYNEYLKNLKKNEFPDYFDKILKEISNLLNLENKNNCYHEIMEGIFNWNLI